MSTPTAIDLHVETTRRRIGEPPTYVCKIDTDDHQRHQVYLAVCQKHIGYPVSHLGREIRVWGVE